MGGINVTRIDGGNVQHTGAHFKRLGKVNANLRRGYQVEMLPYPNTNGSFLERLVRPSRGSVTSAIGLVKNSLLRNRRNLSLRH